MSRLLYSICRRPRQYFRHGRLGECYSRSHIYTRLVKINTYANGQRTYNAYSTVSTTRYRRGRDGPAFVHSREAYDASARDNVGLCMSSNAKTVGQFHHLLSTVGPKRDDLEQQPILKPGENTSKEGGGLRPAPEPPQDEDDGGDGSEKRKEPKPTTRGAKVSQTTEEREDEARREEGTNGTDAKQEEEEEEEEEGQEEQGNSREVDYSVAWEPWLMTHPPPSKSFIPLLYTSFIYGRLLQSSLYAQQGEEGTPFEEYLRTEYKPGVEHAVVAFVKRLNYDLNAENSRKMRTKVDEMMETKNESTEKKEKGEEAEGTRTATDLSDQVKQGESEKADKARTTSSSEQEENEENSKDEGSQNVADLPPLGQMADRNLIRYFENAFDKAREHGYSVHWRPISAQYLRPINYEIVVHHTRSHPPPEDADMRELLGVVAPLQNPASSLSQFFDTQTNTGSERPVTQEALKISAAVDIHLVLHQNLYVEDAATGELVAGFRFDEGSEPERVGQPFETVVRLEAEWSWDNPVMDFKIVDFNHKLDGNSFLRSVKSYFSWS